MKAFQTPGNTQERLFRVDKIDVRRKDKHLTISSVKLSVSIATHQLHNPLCPLTQEAVYNDADMTGLPKVHMCDSFQ